MKISQGILLQTDRYFSEMSVSDGIFKAFHHNEANFAIKGFLSYFRAFHSGPVRQICQLQTGLRR